MAATRLGWICVKCLNICQAELENNTPVCGKCGQAYSPEKLAMVKAMLECIYGKPSTVQTKIDRVLNLMERVYAAKGISEPTDLPEIEGIGHIMGVC